MTRYEQGFLAKCAEYGVPEHVAGRMLKAAQTQTYYDDKGAIPQKTTLWDRAKSLVGVPTPQARAEAAKQELAREAAETNELRRRVDAANAQIGDLAGVSPIRFYSDFTPGDVDYAINNLNREIQDARNERFGERGWQHRIDEQQAELDNARQLFGSILPEKPTPAFYRLSPASAARLSSVVPPQWMERHRFETRDKENRRLRALAWKRNQLSNNLISSGVDPRTAGEASMGAIK